MTSKSQELRYIESNPEVCHGKWVIRGTRILVSVIRQQIARGMSPEQIIGQWHGKVSVAAVEEIIDSEVEDANPPVDDVD